MNRIELTNEEQELYYKKRFIIDDLYKYVLKTGENFNVIKRFTIKEIFQQDFLEFAKKYNDTFIEEYVYYHSHDLQDVLEDIDDANYVYDRLIEFYKEYYKYINSDSNSYYTPIFNSFYRFIVICESIYSKFYGEYTQEELIIKLLNYSSSNNGFLKFNSEFKKYIDKTVANGHIKNFDDFKNAVDNGIYDYSNYPLLIANPNFTDEEKINVIKKTYKQTDLNKYKTFLSQELKSFKCLDLFIQATIFQNNRIKQKDDALIEIFKFMFIETSRTDKSRVDLIKDANSLEDSNKIEEYKNKYFKNPEFVDLFWHRAIITSRDQSRRETSFNALINALFEDDDLDDIIDVMYNIKAYNNVLYKKVENKYKEIKYSDLKEKVIQIIMDHYKLINYESYSFETCIKDTSITKDIYEFGNDSNILDNYMQTRRFTSVCIWKYKDYPHLLSLLKEENSETFFLPTINKLKEIVTRNNRFISLFDTIKALAFSLDCDIAEIDSNYLTDDISETYRKELFEIIYNKYFKSLVEDDELRSELGASWCFLASLTTDQSRIAYTWSTDTRKYAYPTFCDIVTQMMNAFKKIAYVIDKEKEYELLYNELDNYAISTKLINESC